MKIIENPEVFDRIASYPNNMKNMLLLLRKLIFKAAKNIDSTEVLEEIFRWNEPTYVTKLGSAVRIDWKRKTPDRCYIYFNCKTRIVDTVKHVYHDSFKYEKSRAIYFFHNDIILEDYLTRIITASLTYHKAKNLDFLGLSD